MTWNRDKKAWRGEAVKLRHTLSNKDSCSKRFLTFKSNLPRCKSCLPNRSGLVSAISHQVGEF